MKKKEENFEDQQGDILEPGKFYLINNRYDEALKFFLEIQKKLPNNPEVYYHLGLIYEAKNDLQKAKEMFLKTIEISPQHKLAKKHLDKILGIDDNEKIK